MIKLNKIQIEVHGLTGVGKSHVMTVIEQALKDAYPSAQVSSYDLKVERNGCHDKDMQKPNPQNTVFWISEGRVSDYRKMEGLTIKEG